TGIQRNSNCPRSARRHGKIENQPRAHRARADIAANGGSPIMTWTCEQTELHLSDYLDGLLPAEEQRAFDLHVNTCERCTPLVSSVAHAVANLRALPEIEAPPRLVYNILDKTLGPRETIAGWAAVRAWIRGIASPKFAYGSLSVAATFLMLVTASGFNWKKPKMADLA